MTQSPLPEERESQRLKVLREYHILDTQPEQEFDALVELAASVCGTPIALITFFDEGREWCKAKWGLDLSEALRTLSLHQRTLVGQEVVEMGDTSEDPRFAASHGGKEGPLIRFYAGAALYSPDGYLLGSLCVIDTIPRSISNKQKKALRTLANQIVSHLELRKRLMTWAEVITGQKQANQRLKAQEQLVQGCYDASKQFLVISDYWKALASALPTIGKALEVTRISIYEHTHLPDTQSGFVRRFYWSENGEDVPVNSGPSSLFSYARAD